MTQTIIDLTRTIEPTDAQATRKFVVNIHDALAVTPDTVRPEGEW